LSRLHSHAFPTRRSSDLGEYVFTLQVTDSTNLSSSIQVAVTITSSLEELPADLRGAINQISTVNAFVNICSGLDGPNHTLVNNRSEEHTSELQSRENLVC